MKVFSTIPHAAYVVTVASTPCLVSAVMPDNSVVDLLTAVEPGQYGIASPASSIKTSQDDALLTRVEAAVAFTDPTWYQPGNPA